MRDHILYTVLAAAMLAAAPPIHAERGAECDMVHFGQPDWTGVAVKTATAAWVLERLGYETRTSKAALPITYQALSAGAMDVMLAQWLPSQRERFRPYGIEGSIDILSANLRGTHYTIAVPDYVHAAGVTDIADLDRYRERFGGRIHGIDFGSGGNETLQQMIQDDYAGLGDWTLVDSSVPGMLETVRKSMREGSWIAFLGWEPHPMNIRHDIEYLDGGDAYWGPDRGRGIVNTVVRRGFGWLCPNVGQFLANYKWGIDEQSLAMAYVERDGMTPLAAGRRLLREHPGMLDRWLSSGGIHQAGGIRTADGEDAPLARIEAALTR